MRELGIGFAPYSPLGRGFLTSAVKPAAEYEASDMRRWDERWQGDNYTKNVTAVQQLIELAKTEGMTVAQLALGWLLAQGDDIVPTFGTKNRTRLDENVGAARKPLSAAALTRVKEILRHGSFGARYPAKHLPDWK